MSVFESGVESVVFFLHSGKNKSDKKEDGAADSRKNYNRIPKKRMTLKKRNRHGARTLESILALEMSNATSFF